MRHVVFAGFVVLFGVGTVGGCGSNGKDSTPEGTGTGDGGSASALSEANVREALFSESCAAMGDCCDSGGREFDADACLLVQAHLVAEGLFDGSVYDQQAAAACLVQIRSNLAACRWIDANGPCQRMFVGTLAEGASCQEDSDCAPVEGADVSCDYATSEAESDPNGRTCLVAHRGTLGETCNTSCFGGGTNSTSCGSSGSAPTDGVTCWDSDGLECDSTTFTCVSLGTEGQPCTSVSCAVGLSCDPMLDTPVCVPNADTDTELGSLCTGG